jgi:uncharacterized protein
MPPMDHLRFSSAEPLQQERALRHFIHGEPWLMAALGALADLGLSDSWVVAGAIYNMVWNRLTGQAPTHGINDIDIFYFDDSDLSYEAEDAVIRQVGPFFAGSPVPVEIRNQARVHLWFPDHFGYEIAPLKDSRDSIGRFSSVAYCVGARLDARGKIEIHAPHGLSDLFSFRVAPNRAYNNNRATHDKKAARVKALWPQLSILPWE